MLEQSEYRLLGCLDYSLSAFFQVGLNEKAIFSEFTLRITAVMPESPSCTVHCFSQDSSPFTGKASRCLQGSVVVRSWFTTTGPDPVFLHLLCGGPTAFSAFIQYSFFPEDVVGMGMVSRRYPRFSFLCQGFTQFPCPEHIIHHRRRSNIQVLNL